MKEMHEGILLAELADCCTLLGGKTRLVEGSKEQLGQTLRALMPVGEEGDEILMEFQLFRYNEKALFLQFYSTLVTDIPPEHEAELNRAIVGMNFRCMLGSYGIYRPLKQFYHKYGLLLEEHVPTCDLSDRVTVVLGALYRLVTDVFPIARGLAYGVITVEEAERKGLLLPLP